MNKPTDTPDINAHRWWYMRFKMCPRGKFNVMLVELVLHEGAIYVNPWQDNNHYPLSFCDDWQATFLPAESPPTEESWKAT